ncbi:hypothetical protein ACHAXT_000706 [Thalassiosira profunda]
MSFTTRLADVAHKTFVTGCFGFFGYQAYQLGGAMIAGRDAPEQENPHAGFIQMVRDQYDQEYKKYFDTGHRDWYDKDDNSYLDKVPKPRDYQPGGKKN